MIEPQHARNSSSPECDSVERLRVCDWREVAENLDQRGYAIVDTILSPEQCESMAGLYGAEEHSAAESTWEATALAAASTSISIIHCLAWSRACVSRYIRVSRE